jgi:hypothetical protein
MTTRYAGEHIIKLWDRIQCEMGDPIISFRLARSGGDVDLFLPTF